LAEAKSYYVRGTSTNYRPPNKDDEYFRRVRAERYEEELAKLGGGASLADIQAAGERADRSMAEAGMPTSREIQARENLKDTSGWARSTMPLAVSVYKPFGWAVDQLPGEAVTKATRERGEAVLGEISAGGENRTAELLGGIGGALLDPVTYTGYGALTKLGAGARSLAAAKGLARPTAGLGGRVAGEAALGVAVETPIAHMRGDEDPLLSGVIGGAVGGAMPVMAFYGRGIFKKGVQPWHPPAGKVMSADDLAAEIDAVYAPQRAERKSRLAARKVVAELTEAADDAARRGDVAEANKLRERAARQVEQDEVLGKMGVELYGVRKAAGEQAELLDKARDIDVDVPSTQVDKFQKRAAQTAKLRGEAVPETPSVRPEVEADVAARQVDEAVREDALKDPDVIDEIATNEAMGMSREAAERMAIYGEVPTSKAITGDAPTTLPKGATGDQLAMFQLNSGIPLDQMIGDAIKLGKWAKPHVVAGARWAMDTAGDAIRSMRDFAQVMIDKFGRGVRKHIPEMWQKFKTMRARQADFRARTKMRRSRGAIDLRGPRKPQVAEPKQTSRQREIAFAEQRESLRKSAREYVKGKIDPASPRGLQLTEQANTVRTKKSLASFQRKVDAAATGKAQRESIKQATDAGRSLSKMDKASGINMRGVATDSNFAGAMDNLRTLGVANPLNPARQELVEMGVEGRVNFMEAVEQVKKSYIHSRKYGKRPHAEGANPLTEERGFVNEGWGRGVRRLFQLGGEALDTAIDPVADRVRRYSPRLLGRLRTYTSDHLMERHRYRERIDPMMKSVNSALKKFPKDAKVRLTSALSRGDEDAVMRIADAMGDNGDTVRALWAESRVVLDELYKKAREAGIDVGFLENYWPRLVKRGRADDLATFFTKKPTNDMTRALSIYAKREGISVDAIPPAKRREIVDSVTRGGGPQAVDGGRPGPLKHRTIGDIPDEAQHFYESYDAAMDVYIDRITEAIARKKMFGADVPLNASEGDPFGMGGASKIDTTDDLNASIGAILDSDGVPPEKVGETLEVIRTLFNSASTSVGPVTANLRAFGYMATMGQLKSALAQLEDIASTAVFMPHEIPNMARAFARSVPGKTEASTIRIGADRVAEEFAGQRGAERAVNLLFKTTGLSKIDRVIKNTTLESALIGGQKAARKPGSKAYNRLMKESEEMWGKEGAEKLVKDLADGNFSDEVATHLHSKLADIQPLTSLDVPLGYHYMKQVGGKSAWAGAPVLTYQLKTFFLRRMGALRREGVTGMARGVTMIKNGERAEGTKLLLRSTRNLTAMAAVLTAAGATRQQAVGYLYGNENDVSYDVTDAMLSLTGLNRYSTQQLQRGGADFYSSVFAPPSATTALDVITDGFRMADGKMPRTLKRVPHIQTLDIFSRGGFSDYMRGGSKPKEEDED